MENGYSCAPTIGLISPEVLDEIEVETGKNLRDVIDKLDCCNADTYKKQTTFKFLPGHRRFILNMPTEIKKMKEQMPSNTRARKKPKPARKNSLAKQMPTDSNSVSESVETALVELDQSESSNTDQHDAIVKMLELELIKKLKNRGKNDGYDWEKSLTINSIDEMELNIGLDGEVINGKCRLICPVCGTKYLCNYERFWQTSNLLKHLQSHESPKNLCYNSQNDGENNKQSKHTGNNSSFGSYSDDTNEEHELQRNIQLRINSLASPEKT